MHARYLGPYASGNELGLTGWVAVAAVAGPTPSTLTIDLAGLEARGLSRPGTQISAIRYAAGAGGFNSTTGQPLVRDLGSSRLCCGPSVDTALEPCPPERCPIKSSGETVSCAARMAELCGDARQASVGHCLVCLGHFTQDLWNVGCAVAHPASASDLDEFCARGGGGGGSSGSSRGTSLQLPAAPFFASITKAGKCKCFAPQECDE